MAPVPEPIRYTGQTERMTRIPEAIPDHKNLDIVVFQESIVPSLNHQLSIGMHRLGFTHHTQPLSGTFKLVHGGIVLHSRWPIIKQEALVFEGLCDREDCLAAKGCIYTRIRKGKCDFHVFSVHLNAWESPKSRRVRRGQMMQVRQLIEKQQLDETDPIIILGDFNVDLYSEQRQLRALIDLVNGEAPSRHPDSEPFTSDPLQNQLMGIDDPDAYRSPAYPDGCYQEYRDILQCLCCPQELLDHVLVSRTGRPWNRETSWTKIVNVKVQPFEINMTATMRRSIRDLSDHFPVQFQIQFEGYPEEDEEVIPRPVAYKPHDHSTMLSYVSMAAITLVLVLTVYIWWRRH